MVARHTAPEFMSVVRRIYRSKTNLEGRGEKQGKVNEGEEDQSLQSLEFGEDLEVQRPSGSV